MIQVRHADLASVQGVFHAAGLGRCLHEVGRLNSDDRLRIVSGGQAIFEASRVELRRAWSETTCRLQRLRDNPALRAAGV